MYVLIERHGTEVHPMSVAASDKDAQELVNQAIELYCMAKGRQRDFAAAEIDMRANVRRPNRKSLPVMLAYGEEPLRGSCRFDDDQPYEIIAIETKSEATGEKPLARKKNNTFTTEAVLSGRKAGVRLVCTCQAEYEVTVDVPIEFTLEQAVAYAESKSERLRPDYDKLKVLDGTYEICEVIGLAAPNVMREKPVEDTDDGK